jgi:hypothetical protein
MEEEAMTPTEMNLAIAEWCWVVRIRSKEECDALYQEWLKEQPHPHAELTCPHPIEMLKGKEIPDYCGDLNAIQDAIFSQCWGDSDEVAYYEQLREICDPHNQDPFAVCCATAAQRAEALLRVLGKWREE